MHSITLNQNWKFVRVTLDPPQKGPSKKVQHTELKVHYQVVPCTRDRGDDDMTT